MKGLVFLVMLGAACFAGWQLIDTDLAVPVVPRYANGLRNAQPAATPTAQAAPAPARSADAPAGSPMWDEQARLSFRVRKVTLRATAFGYALLPDPVFHSPGREAAALAEAPITKFIFRLFLPLIASDGGQAVSLPANTEGSADPPASRAPLGPQAANGDGGPVPARPVPPVVATASPVVVSTRIAAESGRLSTGTSGSQAGEYTEGASSAATGPSGVAPTTAIPSNNAGGGASAPAPSGGEGTSNATDNGQAGQPTGNGPANGNSAGNGQPSGNGQGNGNAGASDGVGQSGAGNAGDDNTGQANGNGAANGNAGGNNSAGQNGNSEGSGSAGGNNAGPNGNSEGNGNAGGNNSAGENPSSEGNTNAGGNSNAGPANGNGQGNGNAGVNANNAGNGNAGVNSNAGQGKTSGNGPAKQGLLETEWSPEPAPVFG